MMASDTTTTTTTPLAPSPTYTLVQNRVCVIGAGPSGLSCARWCLHYDNLVPTVFEQTDEVGGVWVYRPEQDHTYGRAVHSSCYEHLKTNTTSMHTAFSDYPMPLDFPSYPSHYQIREYLNNYADAFNLRPYIQFYTRVVSVTPIWDAEANALLLASSTTDTPPSSSTATTLTTHTPTDTPSSTTPKLITKDPVWGRPCVWQVCYVKVDEHGAAVGEPQTEYFGGVAVGNGHHWDPIPPEYSGMDKFKGIQLHSHLYRDPSFCVNQRVLVVGMGISGNELASGISKVASNVVLSTKRWNPCYATRSPSPNKTSFLSSVVGSFWGGDKEKSSTKQSQREPSGVGFSIVPDIKRIKGYSVEFTDDTKQDFDIIIYCTGYKLSFPFFEPGLIKPETSPYRLGLYKHVFHPDLPRVAFLGIISANGSIHPVSERQGMWFAKLMAGKAMWNPRDVMERDINTWAEGIKRFNVKYRPHQIDVFSYIDEIDACIDAGTRQIELQQRQQQQQQPP